MLLQQAGVDTAGELECAAGHLSNSPVGVATTEDTSSATVLLQGTVGTVDRVPTDALQPFSPMHFAASRSS
jgi:hypothetical protein